MSETVSTSSSASTPFQAMFISALKRYEKRTKEDLMTHPLASQLQSCDTPADILAVLHEKAREFDQARVGDERLTRWLNPTVSVLYAFSAALGGGVGLVFSPASVIFAGIGVFLVAARDVSASQDVVMDLFERMEFFFRRLETYTEVTPTAAMTDIITKIMVEVLTIFGIATKEIKQGRGKRFLKKLAGRTDIEDALKRLDRLTQAEARMVLAEVLKITHTIREVVINDGKEAKVTAMEAATTIDHIKWNQLQRCLRSWLSPSDPSINHNIALSTQHEGSTVWFVQGRLYIEWRSTGSLLWVHGKPGSGKSIICSSIIQDIAAICETGSAIMAYFYFDFRDDKKQTCHDLLLSLVIQLSTRSHPCHELLNRIYTTHEDGARQPSDAALKDCLKEMLKLSGQCPIFIVMDALDECPNSSGMPSPRNQVLRLVKDLVDLHLQNLHICVTSRPETDIRSVLKPLAFRSVSLQDESGQKADIAEYIRSVVYSDMDTAMKRWRTEEKDLVIEALTERADGMFRWVFCQLETLQHCFPQSVRQFLDELPESLDETYEQILKGIPKAKEEQARRLLQCLAVAVRPLRVEELTELLAFDFGASAGGDIPRLRADWRLGDQEEVILSICSSLVTVVQNVYPRVVQFSHFSVKEYLTSPRLAHPNRDISHFHIRLEQAHTILAQACLGTLLRLDQGGGNGVAEKFPLADYAARHWVAHAQFETVSSGIQKGVDDLFDPSKPHLAAWLRTHDIDKDWDDFTSWTPPSYRHKSPLYYAALCGFYDLAKRLIVKYPEDVQAAAGNRMFAPLSAALRRKHFRVADLLYQHGAAVDTRDFLNNTTLHSASMFGLTDIVEWFLAHGADVHSQAGDRWTPLHLAANNNHLEVVQVLLDHGADVHSSTGFNETPLSFAVDSNHLGVVQLLVEHGADPNARGLGRLCPLHVALTWRSLEVVRLLLKNGADVHEKDKRGMSPFQVASAKGFHEITELLLEYGAKPEP